MVAFNSGKKSILTRMLVELYMNKISTRIFLLTALLGAFILMLGQSQAQASPVFFRPFAGNIDVQINNIIIGNNNVIVNNIANFVAGNVFGLVGGIDPPVPAFNPFNGFVTPGNIRLGPADASYDSIRDESKAIFSGPGGASENIQQLTLQNTDATHIGLPFAGGGQAGLGGEVRDILNAKAITMDWTDSDGNHIGNFPVIGIGVVTGNGGPPATVNFDISVTPASDIQTFPGFEFASPLSFNEHGYFQIDPNRPWELHITNPNPFDVTIEGNFHIDFTGAVPDIATLTEFLPQPNSDVNKYLVANGLSTIPDSFYDTSFFSGPQTIIAGGELVSSIPEPNTIALAATGLFYLIGYGWKRQKYAIAQRELSKLDV